MSLQSIPISHPRVFIQNLKDNTDLFLLPDGSWYIKNHLYAIFRKVFGCENSLPSVAKTAAIIFAKNSFIPQVQGVIIAPFSQTRTVAELFFVFRTKLLPQASVEKKKLLTLLQKRDLIKIARDEDFLPCIEINQLLRAQKPFSSLQAVTSLQRVRLMFIYMNISQKVLEKTFILQKDLQFLIKELKKWQNKQFPFVDYTKSKDGILEKVLTCCRYRQCIAFCRYNPLLLETLFNAVFKNFPDDCTDAVHIFIQMPYLLEKLHSVALDKRIRELHNQGISFIEWGSTEAGTPIKDLLLKIHGSMQSIVDVHGLVRIAPDETMRVSKLFEEFKKQNYTLLEIECVESGIERFDGRLSIEFLQQEDWWKQLPVIKKMSRSDISACYETSFSEGYAFFALKASRALPKLEAGNNHAWIDLALPLDDGTFSVLSVGKYAETFPRGAKGTLRHIFKTHTATLTVNDPNMFMSSRQRISLPFPPLDQQTTLRLLHLIKTDLIAALKGQLIFQAQGNNCAFWVSSLVHRLFPDLPIHPYTTRFEELSLPKVLSPIISSKRIFPTFRSWNYFRMGVSYLLGAGSKKKVPQEDGTIKEISLFQFQPWKDDFLQIPGKLFQTKESSSAPIHAMLAQIPFQPPELTPVNF